MYDVNNTCISVWFQCKSLKAKWRAKTTQKQRRGCDGGTLGMFLGDGNILPPENSSRKVPGFAKYAVDANLVRVESSILMRVKLDTNRNNVATEKRRYGKKKCKSQKMHQRILIHL